MKSLLMIFGIALILVGLLWMAQGTGLVMWPSFSPMLEQRPWALRGGVMVVVGLTFILWSRRRVA